MSNEAHDNPEQAQQRRAASERLADGGQVGAEAQLREAMDPANRSLNEALHLSFRVLQVASVALLVLFLFSGFRTVGNVQSGVATVWGRIVDPAGLEPGLAMNWPPPVGGFVLYEADSRTVTDGNAFVSQMLLTHGEAKSVQRAITTDRLKPGRDGSVLTANGEISHLRAIAHYKVDSPARFLENVGDAKADRLVQLALQRSIVQVGASHTLSYLRDTLTTDGLRSLIRDGANELLDQAGAGLVIASVELKQEPLPPAAIQKNFENYSKVRQQMAADVERAKQAAQETLLTTAGPMHVELAELIDQYEHADEAGDEAKAAQVLAKIDTALQRDDVAGRVARVMDAASRHKIGIEQTLGREARLVAGLQDAYHRQPEVVVARRWLEAAGRVFSRPDIELFHLPEGMGRLAVDITGSQTVRDMRRSLKLDQVDAEIWAAGFSGSATDQFQHIDEIKMDDAGRQLAVDEKGRISGMREKD
ncbi:MAG: hypothetical protein MK101_10375 [Phycisphaerales bacterium]|nr:hypothetical protein [Phycisphaerales bacterium]